MKKKLTLLALLSSVALLGGFGCSTNTQGDTATPVFLTVDFTLAPLEKNVASGTFLQIQTITLKSVFKIPPSGSTQFLDTKVDDYIVEWKRIDGGTKAPGSEVFGGNVIVPAGGTSTLSNFPVMTPSALILPPLDQLFPFNGGIDRETGRPEIRCVANVTFRGHTLSGQPVSGTGHLDMNFVYIPPAGRIVARPVKH